MVTREGSRPASAEQRLKKLGITLPAPPQPFGTYAEAVQTGNLLFLTGMLPTEGSGAKFIGRVGAGLGGGGGVRGPPRGGATPARGGGSGLESPKNRVGVGRGGGGGGGGG